jgi:two-component system sensor histidine kinase MprB
VIALRGSLPDRVSLAYRVALLAALAVGTTVGAVCLVVYLTVRSQLIAELDESLHARAHGVVHAAGADPSGNLASLSMTEILASDMRLGMVFQDGRGWPATGSATLVGATGEPELAVARGDADSSVRTVRVSGEAYRVVAVPSGKEQALVLAQSLEPTQATLDKVGTVFWVIGLSGVVLAGIAGWAVASTSLRPVRRLTAAAERVARTEDLERIEVSGDDELARLTIAFNSMLGALDASLHRQRQLVADAGHELRTPLTSLRTNIELLSQAEGRLPERARTELLADIRAQIGELSTLVGDLVELARDEPLPRHPETVDLSEVVDNAVERVQRRGPGITFQVRTEPWAVLGDPQLLERAVTNLLDNAATWSPPLGTVHVELADGLLSVADEGPGISEEDLPHVFERFYRSSEARTLPGSGLGLAIVQQTAERHGGQVHAGRAAAGGALFTMRLPGRLPEGATPELAEGKAESR